MSSTGNSTAFDPVKTADVGRQVIRQEQKALGELADMLDGDFSRAVEAVLACRGRVAVTGMGKSGHVARKIAATLASTGTPAYFLHPAEAGHGDLGMVTTRDLILALSNSGETKELLNVLDFANRHNVPVVAVTSRRESVLGRMASIVLELPKTGEAKPLECAPTTTTTMSLALGDALAMAVLHVRGFTEEQFHEFHPHGALGRRLALAGEIMAPQDKLPLVAEDTPFQNFVYVMSSKGFGCTGVVNADGRLVGIVTDGDLRRLMDTLSVAQDGKDRDLMSLKACEVMTHDPLTAHESEPASRIFATMHRKKVTCIFIVRDGKPVGLLHVHDEEKS